MPKTRLDKDDKLQRLIRRYMFESNLAVPELARKMNVSEPTMYSRMKNTESLKLSEMKKLQRVLHIPVDELRGAII